MFHQKATERKNYWSILYFVSTFLFFPWSTCILNKYLKSSTYKSDWILLQINNDLIIISRTYEFEIKIKKSVYNLKVRD